MSSYQLLQVTENEASTSREATPVVDEFSREVHGLSDAKSAKTRVWDDWTHDPWVFKTGAGEPVFEINTIKLTLVRVEILQAPYYRIYSTLNFNAKTHGWTTRNLAGYDPPIEVLLMNSAGGVVETWSSWIGAILCNTNNENRTRRSKNFDNDFYDVAVQASLNVGEGRFYRC